MSESAEIFLLSPLQIDYYWPSIDKCLDAEPDLWNHIYTKEGLFKMALEQSMQVWVICPKKGGPITTTFFSQILNSEVSKQLLIFWIWGHEAMDSLAPAALAVDRFAEQVDCDYVKVVGRRGWIRALKDFGGEFESVTLARPVRRLKGH